MQPQITTQKVEALAQISLVCEAELYERFGQDDKRRAQLMLRTLIDAKDEVFEDQSGQAYLLALDVNAGFQLTIEPVSDEYSPADREFDFSTPYINDELITALAVIEGQQREHLRAMVLRGHHGWPYAKIGEDLQAQKPAEPRKWSSDTGKDVAARLLGVALKGCGLFPRDQFPWVVLGSYAESNDKIEQLVEKCIKHEQICDMCFGQHVSVARLLRVIAAVIPPRDPQLRASAAGAEVFREASNRASVGTSPPASGGLTGTAENPESAEPPNAAALSVAEMQDAQDFARVAVAGGDEEVAAWANEAAQADTSSLTPPGNYAHFESPENVAPVQEEEVLAAVRKPSEDDASQLDLLEGQQVGTDEACKPNVIEIDVLDENAIAAPASSGLPEDDDFGPMFFEDQDEGLDGVDQQLEELARLDVRRRVLAARQGDSEAIARGGAAELLSPNFRAAESAFDEIKSAAAGQRGSDHRDPPARPLEVAGPEGRPADAPAEQPPVKPEAELAQGVKQPQAQQLSKSDEVGQVEASEVKSWGTQLSLVVVKDDDVASEATQASEIEPKQSKSVEAPEVQVGTQGVHEEDEFDFEFDFPLTPSASASSPVGQLAERWAAKSASSQESRSSSGVDRPRGVYPAPGGDAKPRGGTQATDAVSEARLDGAARFPAVSTFDPEPEEDPGEGNHDTDSQPAAGSQENYGLSRRRFIAAVCVIIALIVSIGVVGFGGGTSGSQIAGAPPSPKAQPAAKAKPKKAKRKRAKKSAKKTAPLQSVKRAPVKTYAAPKAAPAPAPAPKIGDGSSEFLPEERG